MFADCGILMIIMKEQFVFSFLPCLSFYLVQGEQGLTGPPGQTGPPGPVVTFYFDVMSQNSFL